MVIIQNIQENRKNFLTNKELNESTRLAVPSRSLTEDTFCKKYPRPSKTPPVLSSFCFNHSPLSATLSSTLPPHSQGFTSSYNLDPNSVPFTDISAIGSQIGHPPFAHTSTDNEMDYANDISDVNTLGHGNDVVYQEKGNTKRSSRKAGYKKEFERLSDQEKIDHIKHKISFCGSCKDAYRESNCSCIAVFPNRCGFIHSCHTCAKLWQGEFIPLITDIDRTCKKHKTFARFFTLTVKDQDNPYDAKNKAKKAFRDLADYPLSKILKNGNAWLARLAKRLGLSPNETAIALELDSLKDIATKEIQAMPTPKRKIIKKFLLQKRLYLNATKWIVEQERKRTMAIQAAEKEYNDIGGHKQIKHLQTLAESLDTQSKEYSKISSEYNALINCKKAFQRAKNKRLKLREIFITGLARIEPKRGSGSRLWHIHWHCVAGTYAPIPQFLLSEIWHEITNDSMIVDIRKVKGKTPEDMARYIGKYISKSEGDSLSTEDKALMDAIFYGQKQRETFGKITPKPIIADKEKKCPCCDQQPIWNHLGKTFDASTDEELPKMQVGKTMYYKDHNGNKQFLKTIQIKNGVAICSEVEQVYFLGEGFYYTEKENAYQSITENEEGYTP